MMVMTELQYAKFIIELDNHPHKEEITQLMYEQLIDDMSVQYATTDADRF